MDVMCGVSPLPPPFHFSHHGWISPREEGASREVATLLLTQKKEENFFQKNHIPVQCHHQKSTNSPSHFCAINCVFLFPPPLILGPVCFPNSAPLLKNFVVFFASDACLKREKTAPTSLSLTASYLHNCVFLVSPPPAQSLLLQTRLRRFLGRGYRGEGKRNGHPNQDI